MKRYPKKIYKKLQWICITFLLVTSMYTLLPIFGQPTEPADLYFQPSYKYLEVPPTKVGDTFTLQVRLANYTEVYAWQFRMFFNATLLNVTSCVYAPPSDFIFGTAYTPVSPSIDNIGGSVLFYANSMPWAPFSGTDIGLAIINFTVKIVPPEGETYSFNFTFAPQTPAPGTWIQWEDNSFLPLNRHTGTYEIKSVPPPPTYLELSPTENLLPTIPGDRIVGTNRAYFDVEILIKEVRAADKLILVQFNITFDSALLQCYNMTEGTFMNNPTWAPYGTYFFYLTENNCILGFIMILPNATGVWDMSEFPSGNGLLATIHFKAISQPAYPNNATCPIQINGVFDHYFLSESETWIPHGSPINSEYTITGYYWQDPDADFTWAELIPNVNISLSFNASTSVGYRNDMGVLIPENAYIVQYNWTWGDGTPNNVTDVPIIDHIYALPGDYNVTLTVTDKDGKMDTISKMLTILEMISHEITFEDHTFHIETISDTSITSINFSQAHRFIRFIATSHFGDDFFCNITIPRELLYSAEDAWYILVDGEALSPTEYIVSENGTHTTIFIPYGPGVHTIHVFGLEAIPEFPMPLLSILFTLMTLLAIILLAKKRYLALHSLKLQ